MMVCLFFWFVYCFIRLVVIVLTGSFVIIAHCFDCYFCKILHFEIFCVGVRYCKILLFENLFTEDCVIFESFSLLFLKICIYLVIMFNCNFVFCLETFGTMKNWSFENFVTMKNCVTLKLRFFGKLHYFENCVALENCVV